MFLLDTNVLSELMSAQPSPQVAAWLSAQPVDQLFTAAVCQAEILSGLAVLPEGRRRSALTRAAHAMFREDFAERILPYEAGTAETYANLFAFRRRSGRPIATIDLMISAIARVHRATVVTRNLSDFEGCGVSIVNPWVA
jgi:predicted nucleic acid-binding protein